MSMPETLDRLTMWKRIGIRANAESTLTGKKPGVIPLVYLFSRAIIARSSRECAIARLVAWAMHVKCNG